VGSLCCKHAKVNRRILLHRVQVSVCVLPADLPSSS
jgi:hypothetical protein